jgi:hypothetical protein
METQRQVLAINFGLIEILPQQLRIFLQPPHLQSGAARLNVGGGE